MKAILKLLCLLLLPSALFAESDRTWEWIGPNAPVVQDIVPDRRNPKLWYVLVRSGNSHEGHLYRTTNFLKGWKSCPIKNVAQVTLHPVTGELFVLVKSEFPSTELWHSVDQGKTFARRIRWPFSVRKIFLHPKNPKTLYAAGHGFGRQDLSISTDGGRRWTITKGLPFPVGSDYGGYKVTDYVFVDLVISPEDPLTVYVTAVLNLAQYTHTEERWLTMVSSSGGFHWKVIDPILEKFFTDPSFPDRVFAYNNTRNEGLLYILGGKKWWFVCEFRNLDQLVSIPGEPRKLLGLTHSYRAGDRQIIVKSIDEGRTWVPTTFHVRDALTTLFSTGNGLLAGTNGGGVYFSSRENVWREASLGLRESNVGWVYRAGTSILASSAPAGCCDLPFLYRSSDNGRSWENLSLTLPRTRSFVFFSINPFDPSQITLSGDGLWVSNDAGESWLEGARTHEKYVAGFDPLRPLVFYLTSWWRPRIYKTYDGGQTIQALPLRFPAYVSPWRIVIDTPNTLYILTTNGLYQSLDGGQTMQDISGPLRQTLKLASSDHLVLYDLKILQSGRLFLALSEDGQVARSEDGGAHWKVITNLSTHIPFYHSADLYPADADGVHFFVIPAESRQLLETTDGGTTFTNISNELGLPFAGTGLDGSILSMSDPRVHPIFVATSFGVFKEAP